MRELAPLSSFSFQQATQRCVDATPQFVRGTLRQLIADNKLQLRPPESDDKRELYEWTQSKSIEDLLHWVSQLVHGNQIKETPSEDRPRERFYEHGVRSLSNAELLAILIRVGIRGESAVQSGNKIAKRFEKDISAIRDKSKAEIREISKAVNISSYAQIMAGIELGRRISHAEQHQRKSVTQINSTAAAIAYCEDAFRDLAQDAMQEEFHIVTLDTKLKPIQNHRITVGTLDASLVHPREVFKAAIRDSASAVLLIHNHPSGETTPSREDHAVTKRLTEAGELIGIRVLDHIIVTRNGGLSIRQSTL